MDAVTYFRVLGVAVVMASFGCSFGDLPFPIRESNDAGPSRDNGVVHDVLFADRVVRDGATDIDVAPDIMTPDVSVGTDVAPDMASPGDAQVDVGGPDTGVPTDVVNDLVVTDVRDARALLDTPDVRDAPDVTNSPDVPDVPDTPDVVDVPAIPMDLGPPPCLPGQDRCGGVECLNLSTNTANCGGCGNACPARPHAPATCSGGSCTLACDTGYLNCDGNLTNGCETTPSTDALNCGACGTVCPTLPNTTPSMCVGGTCSFGCGSGFANCNGTVTDGCEVSTATDPMNCGGCGRACGAGQTCAGGNCICPSGRAPCGGVCPNLTIDVNNCGACGMVCGPDQMCCSGVCQNLQTDRFNCGTCGTRCPSPTTCNSGSCGCTGGRIFCGTACVNASSDSNNCGWCEHICPGTSRRCVNYNCVP